MTGHVGWHRTANNQEAGTCLQYDKYFVMILVLLKLSYLQHHLPLSFDFKLLTEAVWQQTKYISTQFVWLYYYCDMDISHVTLPTIA